MEQALLEENNRYDCKRTVNRIQLSPCPDNRLTSHLAVTRKFKRRTEMNTAVEKYNKACLVCRH
jgi:hypothetical protein